jgi:ribosome-associated toxin RatA of RatAB toxin-antitoxin module
VVTESARATIEIDATPATVMAVIADFAAYPDWVSQLKQVVVVEPGTNGRAAVVGFGLDAGPVADSYTLAYDWSVPGAVSWQLVSSGTFTRLDGSYRLLELPGGRTAVEYQLVIGLKLAMIPAIRRTAERILMSTALASLKARVEG